MSYGEMPQSDESFQAPQPSGIRGQAIRRSLSTRRSPSTVAKHREVHGPPISRPGERQTRRLRHQNQRGRSLRSSSPSW